MARTVRLYPSAVQEEMLRQSAGCCRWLWNYLLGQNRCQYERDKTFRFHREMSAELPQLKRQHDWLRQAPACSLQRVCRNLSEALPRKGRPDRGFPRWKCKGRHESFYLTNQAVQVRSDRLVLSKIGSMRFRGNLLEAKLISAAIRCRAGRWYACLAYEVEEAPLVRPDPASTIGLDLGLSHLVVTSDGEVFDNPRWLRQTQKRLRRCQRRLGRKQRGSHNRRRQQLRLARLHQHVCNQRQDYLHRMTTDLIAKSSVICLEDLNVAGMMRSRLGGSIGDAAWSTIRSQLTYKARLRGRHLVVADRWYPSSQLCSACGARQPMLLSSRTYDCGCGHQMDRDLNAAINLRHYVGRGTPERAASAADACRDTSGGDHRSSHVSAKQECPVGLSTG